MRKKSQDKGESYVLDEYVELFYFKQEMKHVQGKFRENMNESKTKSKPRNSV